MCLNLLNYSGSEIKGGKLYKKIRLIFILFITGVQVFSQEINVEGLFLKDTVKIGEEVPYSLSATYPRAYNIIFPDSSFDFQPFEYHGRQYFKTVSDSAISVDSVVYLLSTFEIDTIQYLQLPVYVRTGGDSLAVYTKQDSINLFHIIQVIPDSVKLKENTLFLRIPNKFNYPVFLFIAGFLLVVIIIALLFFGRRISRWIKIMIMKRNHKRFHKSFYLKLSGVRDNRPGVEPEDVLNDWKKYMEKLEKEPYTKLTTKELIDLHADQRLKDNLRSIDRYIYGSIKDKPLHENFEKLLEYSIERYEVRINELKHG